MMPVAAGEDNPTRSGEGLILGSGSVGSRPGSRTRSRRRPPIKAASGKPIRADQRYRVSEDQRFPHRRFARIKLNHVVFFDCLTNARRACLLVILRYSIGTE